MFSSLPFHLMKPSSKVRLLDYSEPPDDQITLAKQNNFVPPVVVVPMGDEYQILVGVENWILAQRAQVHNIPVIIREGLSDREKDEISQLELSDIKSPLERAEELAVFMKANASLSKREAADHFCMRESTFKHKLRLALIDFKTKEYIHQNRIYFKEGHLKVLVGLDQKTQLVFARQVVARQLSVRNTEIEAKNKRGGQGSFQNSVGLKEENQRASWMAQLETLLSSYFQCEVGIDNKYLRLNYYGNKELLEGIIERTGLRLD